MMIWLSLSFSQDAYESTHLVAEVFKSLCSTEAMCSASLCKDDIMNTLLSPVAQLLDGATVSHILCVLLDIICIKFDIMG